jgi:hypothetical protein
MGAIFPHVQGVGETTSPPRAGGGAETPAGAPD